MNSIKHWSLTRLTSMPLAVLFLYFVAQAEHVASKSRMEIISWIKQPFTTTAIIIFVVCGFWHAQLGMEEIIIDYVPAEKTQKLLLLLNKIFFFALCAACLYAAVAIKFGTF